MLRLEGPMHAGPASTGVGAVHQVVVDERAGLQPLERGRGRDDSRLVRCAARNEPTGVAELGAESLAAGDERDRCVGEALEVGAEVGEERTLRLDEGFEGVINTRPEFGIIGT